LFWQDFSPSFRKREVCVKTICISLAALCVALPLHAQDWTGWYAGLSASANQGGDWEYGNGFVNTGDWSRGQVLGLFGGGSYAVGRLVLGAELGFGRADIGVTEAPAWPGIEQINTLRARIGFAVGRVQPYLAAGIAKARYHDEQYDYDLAGRVYGLGVDVAVTDHSSLGIEVQRFTMDGGNGVTNVTFDSTLDLISLRYMWRF
jgi:hypothetical protein